MAEHSDVSFDARYSDGFTSRMLSWELRFENKKGHLAGRWINEMGTRDSVETNFKMTPEDMHVLLVALQRISAEYDVECTDLEQYSFCVKYDETVLRRSIYGASMIGHHHPELLEFFKVWQPFEDRVLLDLGIFD